MCSIRSQARSMPSGAIAVLAMAALIAVPPVLRAQTTVDLVPVLDNTLYEDPTGSLSNGSGDHCFAGLTAHFSIRRAVFAFDLSTIPSGSIVQSVEFRLTMDRAAGISGPQPMSLHRMTASWGEGVSAFADSFSGGGAGVPAVVNDATWLHRFYPATFWSQPGGDFAATTLATTMVPDALAQYQWGSTPEMVAVVQSWINDPATNFGWMLIGAEAVELSARRFFTREALNPDDRPHLIVTYGTLAASDVPAANALRFHSPAPNPFNPSTTLRWDAPAAGLARISIFDARGAIVARPLEALRPAGSQSFAWQARDARGHTLPSGVYLVQLEQAGETRSRRVVLVR